MKELIEQYNMLAELHASMTEFDPNRTDIYIAKMNISARILEASRK